MQVDFYQLGRDPLATVLASIGGRVLGQGGRLLVVTESDAEALDEALWTFAPDSFLPHGRATPDDPGADQPVLIADVCGEPANGARFVALADGLWRDEALGFERAFYLFDERALEPARAAWRALKGREGVEPRYWRQGESGRWEQMG